MANRDLTVSIRGNVDDFVRAVKAAQSNAAVFGRELTKIESDQAKLARATERAAQRQRDAMTSVGTGMLGFGAAVVGGLGLAVKAAVDWESAWAGVTKTVGGSQPQMDALEKDLRNLAKQLPATHKEIAAVAEAAGALGVKRENIVSFTRTMIDLGETTDLTADMAASALARISNVMGTSQDDVDRFGSALVELGNNGASTESEIVSMAQRIAGAGNQIGLSEGEVLGFASALSSVGVEAEAGGSSISTFFIKMSTAVSEGGADLENFARVAGLSADEFATKFRDDAAGATTLFVEGLGRIQESGGDTFGVLDALGLSEIRLRDAMLRTAGAGDLLRTSIDTGNRAWEQNSALTEEAAKRYETTAAKMEIARNQVNDFAINVGETFLPIMGAAAEKVGGFLNYMSELPQPVQQGAAVLGGLVGSLSLLGGAALIAVPKMVEFRNTLGEMGPKGQAVGKALSGTASFLAGPWGLALGAGVLALGMFLDAKADAAAEVRTFTAAIEADSGALEDNTRVAVVNELSQRGLLETAKELGIPLNLLTDAILGNADAHRQVSDMIEGEKSGLEAWGLVAQDNFWGRNQLREAIDGTSESVRKGQEEYRREQEALALSGQAHDGTATAAGSHATAQGELNIEIDDGTTAAEKLEAALKGLTGTHLTADEAMIRYLGAIDRATEGVERNGTATDLGTEKGRDHRQALIDQAQAAQDMLVAMVDNGATTDDVREKHDAARLKLIELAIKMGHTSTEARRLAGEYLGVSNTIDGRTRQSIIDIASKMDNAKLSAHNAAVETSGFHHEVRTLPDGRVVKIAVDPETGEVIDLANRIDNLPPRTTVKIHADGTVSFPGSSARASPFAAGGVLPGYTPGRDPHLFSSPTGGQLALSGGEAIMRPEWTRAVGPDFIHGANRAARQGGIEGVRSYLQRDNGYGAEGTRGDTARFFATGGIYPFSPEVVTVAHREVQNAVIRWQQEQIKKWLAQGGSALSFARSHVGKPYVWGGVGPGGFDCSGFMSAITRHIRGQYPYARVGATGNFPWPGFRPGFGPGLTIGSFRGNPGHMAGTIGNTNVESSSGVGVRVGGGARGAGDRMFTVRAHLPAFDDGGIFGSGRAALNASGSPERVLSPRQTEAFERLVTTLSTIRGLTTPQVAAAGGAATAAVHKHFHLTVHNAGNNHVDLETQFHRLELRAGI